MTACSPTPKSNYLTMRGSTKELQGCLRSSTWRVYHVKFTLNSIQWTVIIEKPLLQRFQVRTYLFKLQPQMRRRTDTEKQLWEGESVQNKVKVLVLWQLFYKHQQTRQFLNLILNEAWNTNVLLIALMGRSSKLKTNWK